MTLVMRTVSDRIIATASCGVLAMTSRLTLNSLSRVSGWVSARTTSLLMRAITAGGVFTGANNTVRDCDS